MNRTDQNLRAAISRNENRALWCAGMVIFGLTLEVIFAVWFHERPSLIARWGPVVSDVIVAAGVAGEVIFGRKARLDSEELTRRSDERAAKLEKEAAEANKTAAQANASAAMANVALAQLRKQVGPRQIENHALFFEVLNMAASKPEKVLVRYHPNAADGFVIGTQIVKLLVEAEWPVHGPEIMPLNSSLLRHAPQTPIISGTSSGSGIAVVLPMAEAFAGPGVGSPYLALSGAIAVTLGGSGGYGNGSDDLTPGELAVLIFPR